MVTVAQQMIGHGVGGALVVGVIIFWLVGLGSGGGKR